jgi:uncharacterized protein with von Willebrand factor type A (vWA) domain
MEAALNELRRSISALPPDTNAYVVFFSGGAAELQGFGRWVRAQTPDAERLVQNLVGVGDGGGTNPAPALERAFGQSPRPDELFFMTDGIMPQSVPALIARLNSQSLARTRVHTIAFGQDAERASLEEIARTNGGQFRAVP